MQSDTTRYLIYTRVSKNLQTVETQLKECHDYVTEKKIPHDQVFQFNESDLSTRKPMDKRPKLQGMMAFAQKGDVLVVYKVDRLARHPQELINIFFDLRKKGVTIIGLRDPNVDDQTICIYAFIACAERKNIQTRTISRLNQKKSNMERVGTTWFGYKLDETKLCDREGAKSYGKPYLLLPDDTEQMAINLMVDWHKKGHSYQDIADALEEAGYKNRSGNQFQKMSVYRILHRLKTQDPSQMDLTSAMSHGSK